MSTNLEFRNGKAVVREATSEGVLYTYWIKEGEEPKKFTTLFIPAYGKWTGEDAVEQAMAQRAVISWLKGWLKSYLFAPVVEVQFVPATRPLLGQRGFMFDSSQPDERWFIIDATGSVLWSPNPENKRPGFEGVVPSHLWEALGEFRAEGWTWIPESTPAFLVKVVGPQDGTNKVIIYSIIHPPMDAQMEPADWWTIWYNQNLAEWAEPGIGQGLAEPYDLQQQIHYFEQEHVWPAPGPTAKTAPPAPEEHAPDDA